MDRISKSAIVLMPFDDSFNDIYRIGIKEVVEKHGFICSRVDEEVFHGQIIAEIQNLIVSSDIIIAETTDKNPNVYYEIGYAHALNKQVILITRDAKTLPFDLKGYKHIEYKGQITILREELEKTLVWIKRSSEKMNIIRNPKLLRPASQQALIHLYESGNNIPVAEFLEHAEGILGILNDLRTLGYIRWYGDVHYVLPDTPVHLTDDGIAAVKLLTEK